MSSSIKNLYQFRTTSKIVQAQGATTTFTIGNDIFTGSVGALTSGSILLQNRTGTKKELLKGTAAAGVFTISSRGIKPDGTTNAIYQYERPKNTLCTVVVLEDQIFDKSGSETLLGNLTYGGDIVYNKSVTFPRYADATARDIGIPSPQGGMMIYNIALGTNQQYKGGIRANVDTGTITQNASTTVAGLVEVATTAQNTSGTAIGETGASLVSTPADLSKQIQSGTWLYGTDVGGDDTYVVALTPVLTAYTTGQSLYAKVTTANTGACSFDFGPGAKNVKTLNGYDLFNGVIGANSVVHLIYDGTNLVLQNPLDNILIKIAGEDIAIGNVLRMGVLGTAAIISQVNTGSVAQMSSNNAQQQGQTFTIATSGFLTNINIKLSVGTVGGSGLITFNLHEGVFGAIIASATSINANTLTTSPVSKDFAFSNIRLKAGVYSFSLRFDGNSTPYQVNVQLYNGDIYGGGANYYKIDGGNWTNNSGDLYFNITLVAGTEDTTKIYKASGSQSIYTRIVGFAKNTATNGNSVALDIDYTSNQTGLVTSIDYYLSNTAGTISTTPGTISKTVGRSISATELLINLFGA